MKLLLFLCMASGLAASSIEPWVSGTRPYETVPYNELDATLLGSLGETHSGGARLDWGVLDHWTLWGGWAKSDAATDAQDGVLGTQLRLGEEGEWPLDFGLCYELKDYWQDASGSLRQIAGFVVAKEIWGNSLDSNLLYDSVDGPEARLAYRSPYLFWTLRGGAELVLERPADYPVLIPQVVFELPGDIGIQAGAAIARDGGPTTWLFSAGYEIFPNP
jgi:hypothetical protein